MRSWEIFECSDRTKERRHLPETEITSTIMFCVILGTPSTFWPDSDGQPLYYRRVIVDGLNKLADDTFMVLVLVLRNFKAALVYLGITQFRINFQLRWYAYLCGWRERNLLFLKSKLSNGSRCAIKPGMQVPILSHHSQLLL